MDPIEQEIRSLVNLQEGWDYGEGKPPSKSTINKAIQIYNLAKNYKILTEIFPIGDGDICLSFSQGEIFVDVEIESDGSYNLCIEKGIGNKYTIEEDIEDITFNDIENRLNIYFKNY